MSWSLGVDFGTTATAAAIDRGDAVEFVTFGRTSRLPSGVFVQEDGRLLAGSVALNQGGADPSRYVRTPKRYVGRDRSVIVGGTEVEVEAVVAVVLRTVLEAATAQAGGSSPERIVLTHPVRWADAGVSALTAAAAQAGLRPVELLAEPMAAGLDVLGDGADSPVAVYDLGGGTFDAAVVQPLEGDWVVLGPPGGLDPLGGETFDLLLHRHLVEMVRLVDATAARVLESPEGAAERGLSRTWWRDLRALKEGLSEVSSGRIAVPGTDRMLLLGRDDLEEVLGDHVRRTVEELERVVRGARSTTVDVQVVVSGDASRMPLVHQLIRDRFPQSPVRSADDPKGAVARGALAARSQAASTTFRAAPVRPRSQRSSAAVPYRSALCIAPDGLLGCARTMFPRLALSLVIEEHQVVAEGTDGRHLSVVQAPESMTSDINAAAAARDPRGYFGALLTDQDVEVDDVDTVDAFGSTGWRIAGRISSRPCVLVMTERFLVRAVDLAQQGDALVEEICAQVPLEPSPYRYGSAVGIVVPDGMQLVSEQLAVNVVGAGSSSVASCVFSRRGDLDGVAPELIARSAAAEIGMTGWMQRSMNLAGGLAGVAAAGSIGDDVGALSLHAQLDGRHVGATVTSALPRRMLRRSDPWEICGSFVPYLVLDR